MELMSEHELNLSYPYFMTWGKLRRRAVKLICFAPVILLMLLLWVVPLIFGATYTPAQNIMFGVDTGCLEFILVALYRDRRSLSPAFLAIVAAAFAVICFLDIREGADLITHYKLTLATMAYFVLAVVILNKGDNYPAIIFFSVVAAICAFQYIALLVLILICYTNTYAGRKLSGVFKRYKRLFRLFGFGIVLASIGNLVQHSSLQLVLAYGIIINLMYSSLFKSYFLRRANK